LTVVSNTSEYIPGGCPPPNSLANSFILLPRGVVDKVVSFGDGDDLKSGRLWDKAEYRGLDEGVRLSLVPIIGDLDPGIDIGSAVVFAGVVGATGCLTVAEGVCAS
jgi:hypothetical protein